MSYNKGKNFTYVGMDFKNMSKEQQKETPVRCGKIDTLAVFTFLMERKPTEEELKITKLALAEVGKLSRCHHDLLEAEFGNQLTTADKIVQPTDVLFQYPPDVCINKLNQALEATQIYIEGLGDMLRDMRRAMQIAMTISGGGSYEE